MYLLRMCAWLCLTWPLPWPLPLRHYCFNISSPDTLHVPYQTIPTCISSIIIQSSIVTAFSIEPPSPLFGEDSPNEVVPRPIRGIMTTYGYVLPDPATPNRLSVWFTGGTVEVDDEADSDEWRRVFGDDTSSDAAQIGPMAPPRPGPSLSERAKLLAAKLLLGASVPQGMEEDGSMNFKLRRPVGGHGSAYVDILYLDDTLRIMQGHHGSVYVVARVPGT